MDRTAVATPHSEAVFMEREVSEDICYYLGRLYLESPGFTNDTVTGVINGRFDMPLDVTITVSVTPHVPPCDTPEGK